MPEIHELQEWGLLRVTNLAGHVGMLATGLAREFPELSMKHIVTSEVRSLSEDRQRLFTIDREYALENEIAEYPERWRHDKLWLVYLRSLKTAPIRVEWLRPDGTAYAVMERAEIDAIIEKERTARIEDPAASRRDLTYDPTSPKEVARRREALRQAKANSRIEGFPDYTSQEQEDFVEGKISAAEAGRRIIQRYKQQD